MDIWNETDSQNKPKSRKAAIRLAAQLLIQQQTLKLKEEKLMNRRQALQNKIERLEGDLQKLTEKLQKEEISQQRFARQLQAIRLEWQFTETEILEERLQVLQKQIQLTEAIKRTADGTEPHLSSDDGESDIFSNTHLF